MTIRTKMFLEDMCEAAGAVLAWIVIILLAWLFLLATPDQRSAEADAAAEQLEKAQETRE